MELGPIRMYLSNNINICFLAEDFSIDYQYIAYKFDS